MNITIQRGVLFRNLKDFLLILLLGFFTVFVFLVGNGYLDLDGMEKMTYNKMLSEEISPVSVENITENITSYCFKMNYSNSVGDMYRRRLEFNCVIGAISNYVYSNVNYTYYPKIRGIDTVLENGTGDCTARAIVFASMVESLDEYGYSAQLVYQDEHDCAVARKVNTSMDFWSCKKDRDVEYIGDLNA